MTQPISNWGNIGTKQGQAAIDQSSLPSGPNAQYAAAQASGSSGSQQSPGIFGTGQYYAPAYSGFDANAISGQPAQGASSDYGLNGVWDNLQNFANSQPQNYAVTAPTATAAQGQAAYAQAAQGTAAQGQAASYSAALAQAAQARAAQAQGASAGAATAGPAAMARAPTISTAGDASQLGVQQSLEQTLQNQANGGGTSAADLQLQAGEQQQVANQLAVLGSQRGGSMNAGLAQTQAATQAAQAQATLNQQMGVQRAQETQAAQQALGTVADQARGQSQAYNAAQAGLSSTANLANQGAANQQAQFNASNEQAANLANAQLAQGNSQFNATNATNTSLANAQLAQAANLSNQGALNTAASTNTGNAQAMTLANLLAQNNMTSQNVANAQQTALANAGNDQAMNLANLGNAQQTNLANLSLAGQYGLANQSAAENSYNQYSQNVLAALGAQTGIGEADRSAQLASQQLGVQQTLGMDQINAQAYQAAANANANLTGAVFGTVGAVGSSLLNSIKGSSTNGTTSTTGTTTTGTPSSEGGTSNPTGGSDGGEGNAYTGSQDYTTDVPEVEQSQQIPTPNPYLNYSDENVKEGIIGGNPMMRSFLDQVGQSKQDQSIDPNADMGFRLGTYTKQSSTSGPSDGGIGKTIGSAAGSIGGAAAGSAGGAAAAAAAGAAAGSVVPGIGTAIGAIAGLLGGLFGGAIGGAADGSGSTSTRNVLSNPGTGETADEESISDLDTSNPVSTSDDEAKENVISGNRGMQAFLQQAGAQQNANAAKGATNNAFMQTGQAPSAAVDRPMPAPPPFAQGYGQSQGGGVYGGGLGSTGGFAGGSLSSRMSGYPGGGPSQAALPPFAQTAAPSLGGFTGGGFSPGGAPASQGGLLGNEGMYAGGTTSAGGVGATSAGAQSPRGGVLSFGGTSGTPTAPSIAGLGPMVGAIPGAAQTESPLSQAILGVQPVLPLLAVGPGPGTDSSSGVTYPSSQAVPTAPPYLPNGQSALSDEDSKEKVSNPSPDDMRDFLDALHAHQYRYKEPDLPGAGHGTYVSPMAQEIESTPLGKSFVSTNPDTGYKQVDYGKMAGTQLAGLAYLNERQNKLEELLRTGARAA